MMMAVAKYAKANGISPVKSSRNAGEFAITVGFPAKSGVGGGIMGVIPKKMGIGVFAPALDKHGNSVAGVQLLSRLSQELDLSIY